MKLETIFKTALLPMVLLALDPMLSAQDQETIDHVTNDNVIVLQNGEAYQSDDATSMTWMDNDDVLILQDGTMVNKDENEAVGVTPTDTPDEDDDD